jgi:hypothetical protein
MLPASQVPLHSIGIVQLHDAFGGFQHTVWFCENPKGAAVIVTVSGGPDPLGSIVQLFGVKVIPNCVTLTIEVPVTTGSSFEVATISTRFGLDGAL